MYCAAYQARLTTGDVRYAAGGTKREKLFSPTSESCVCTVLRLETNQEQIVQ